MVFVAKNPAPFGQREGKAEVQIRIPIRRTADNPRNPDFTPADMHELPFTIRGSKPNDLRGLGSPGSR